MMHGLGFAVLLAIMVAWWAVGYWQGRRAIPVPPWSQCADCATRTRKAAFHQLFVEVWGADGVLRGKWPVGVKGGPHSNVDSLLVTDPAALEELANLVRERVEAIYRRQAV